MGEHEDPWIILNIVQEMITDGNCLGKDGDPLFPVLRCDCLESNPYLLSNLEIVRVKV